MDEFTAYYSMKDGSSEIPVVVTANYFSDAIRHFETWRKRLASNPTADSLVSTEPVRVTRDTGDDLVSPGKAITKSNWWQQ